MMRKNPKITALVQLLRLQTSLWFLSKKLHLKKPQKILMYLSRLSQLSVEEETNALRRLIRLHKRHLIRPRTRRKPSLRSLVLLQRRRRFSRRSLINLNEISLASFMLTSSLATKCWAWKKRFHMQSKSFIRAILFRSKHLIAMLRKRSRCLRFSSKESVLSIKRLSSSSSQSRKVRILLIKRRLFSMESWSNFLNREFLASKLLGIRVLSLLKTMIVIELLTYFSLDPP